MESSSAGSVSLALQEVQAGDQGQPLQKLVDRYFDDLAKCAHFMLPAQSRIVQGGEDVANEVFASFCRAVKEGLYKNVENRDDLWRLLFEIMKNKVIDQIRRQKRRKRGSGMVRSEADGAPEFDTAESMEPTPADVAEFNDLLRQLFEKLGEGKEEKRAQQWQTIAQMKLAGYEEKEIAAKVECSVSTVRRCVAEIRKIWSKLAGEAVEPAPAERSDGDSPFSSIENTPIPPAGGQPADGESPNAHGKRAPGPRTEPREHPDG